MEEMTGVEVLKELRGKQDETKVIMVSGVNDEEIVNAAKSYGVRGFVHKPLVLGRAGKNRFGRIGEIAKPRENLR